MISQLRCVALQYVILRNDFPLRNLEYVVDRLQTGTILITDNLFYISLAKPGISSVLISSAGYKYRERDLIGIFPSKHKTFA